MVLLSEIVDIRYNVALEGTLKIHLSELGEFKTHGPIDYSNLDLGEENTSSFSLKKSCAIS